MRWVGAEGETDLVMDQTVLAARFGTGLDTGWQWEELRFVTNRTVGLVSGVVEHASVRVDPADLQPTVRVVALDQWVPMGRPVIYGLRFECHGDPCIEKVGRSMVVDGLTRQEIGLYFFLEPETTETVASHDWWFEDEALARHVADRFMALLAEDDGGASLLPPTAN